MKLQNDLFPVDGYQTHPAPFIAVLKRDPVFLNIRPSGMRDIGGAALASGYFKRAPLRLIFRVAAADNQAGCGMPNADKTLPVLSPARFHHRRSVSAQANKPARLLYDDCFRMLALKRLLLEDRWRRADGRSLFPIP